MRIVCIHIFKCGKLEPILLSNASDLSFAGMFERSTVRQFVNFNSRLVVARTPKEERQEIVLEKGICYSYVTSDNIGISIIADEEYPKRVAFDLIYKIMQNFNEFIFTNKINLEKISSDTDIKFKYIDKVIIDWQNPKDSKFINIFLYFLFQKI
jgi:synaptobrevin family protein YKT6